MRNGTGRVRTGIDRRVLGYYGGAKSDEAAAAAEAADLFDRKGNVVGLSVARAIAAAPTASTLAFEVSPDVVSRRA